jgi:uncharacterized membrane-anchored protein YhcB (DUF1043 family)
MAISDNATKIIAAIAGGLLLALQGTTIVQNKDNQAEVGQVRTNLDASNQELNRLIIANQELFKKDSAEFRHRLEEIDRKLSKETGH